MSSDTFAGVRGSDIHENKSFIVPCEIVHFLHADASGGLFLFFLDFHGFDVLGFENLSAVQTFHVVDAGSSGDDLGAGVLTGGLHNNAR